MVFLGTTARYPRDPRARTRGDGGIRPPGRPAITGSHPAHMTARHDCGMRVLPTLVLTALLATAACATSAPTGTIATPAPRTATSAAAARPALQTAPAAQLTHAAGTPAGAATRPSKVLVVVLENHSQAHALAGIPRLARLARRYAYATDYTATTHPSLPNYLSLIGGSTFGVTDDADPSAHPVHGPSVLDATLARGLSAKTYAESMPANCTLVPAGRYAVKHNPWAYFLDRASRANCLRDDVPAGTLTRGPLHADITTGRLPTVGLLIPNVCDDAHDCPLTTADSWLSSWFAQITQGADWRTGKLAVAVTFDEDDYSQANKVLTVLAYPRLEHAVITSPLNHFSLTGYLDALSGTPPLRGANRAPSFARAFGI